MAGTRTLHQSATCSSQLRSVQSTLLDACQVCQSMLVPCVQVAVSLAAYFITALLAIWEMI
jgi:hypothetical protein